MSEGVRGDEMKPPDFNVPAIEIKGGSLSVLTHFKTVFNFSEPEPVVTFKKDGSVEVNPKYRASEAAKMFWEAVVGIGKELRILREIAGRLEWDAWAGHNAAYCYICGASKRRGHEEGCLYTELRADE